eukprot:359280-Chlamydomonas_euryale.AAC.3
MVFSMLLSMLPYPTLCYFVCPSSPQRFTYQAEDARGDGGFAARLCRRERALAHAVLQHDAVKLRDVHLQQQAGVCNSGAGWVAGGQEGGLVDW